MSLAALRSEGDVEQKVVGPLFKKILHYPDVSIRWKHPVTVILGKEKKTKQADMVAYSGGRPVVTVEAKSPTEPVTEGFGQVDSYAFALQTPYSVVTNGRSFVLRGYYSFNSRINVVEEPISRLESEKWKKVVSLIGSDQVLESMKERAQPVAVPNRQKITDYRRFFRRIHSEIRDRDRLDPAAAFDELSKLLFLKAAEEEAVEEHPGRAVLTPETIAQFEATGNAPDLINQWFRSAIKDYYAGVFEDDPRINLKPETLRVVLEMMQPFRVKNGDVDVKGRAFEEFLPSQLRGEGLGQYFTPRPIVDFMAEMADISITDILVDFSCGSGGFLIKGFDTMQSRVEKLPPGVIARIGTTNAQIMEGIKSNQLFGIDAEPRAARTAKMNMLMWGDGRRVVRGNGLDIKDHDGNPYEPKEYDPEDPQSGCTLILANPPFGSVEKDQAILSRYVLGSQNAARAKERTEVLFLEKGLRLLRPEGRMLIVLPLGVLQTLKDQRVRDFLHSQCEVRAVIGLPTHTFVQSGVQTVNTCILFVQKFTTEKKALYDEKMADKSADEIRALLASDPAFDYPIFMGLSEFVGFEPSGRSIVEEGEKTDLALLLEDFEKQAEIKLPTVDLFAFAAEHYGDKSHKRSEQTVRGTTRGLKASFSVRFSETDRRLDPHFYLFRYQATDLLNSLTPLGDSIEPAGERFFPESDDEKDREYRVLSVSKDGVTEGELRSGWEFKPQYRYQRVRTGDVVYNPARVNIGSIGIVLPEWDGALVSPEYEVFRSTRLESEFLMDLLRSPFYRYYIDIIATGSIRDRLYLSDLQTMRVPNVSEAMQSQIVEREHRAAFILESAYRRIQDEKSALVTRIHRLAGAAIAECEATEDVFHRLAAEWKKGARNLSSVAKRTTLPAYQQIVGMGEDAVPLILSDLAQNGPDHWFWALAAITRHNPVTPAIEGDIRKMTEAWLKWGMDKGYPIASTHRTKPSSPASSATGTK